jgi:hypothetical protein
MPTVELSYNFGNHFRELKLLAPVEIDARIQDFQQPAEVKS